MRLRPQPNRRGVRGQPWCCLGLAATGRPLVLSCEWERTPPSPAHGQRIPAPHRRDSGPPIRAQRGRPPGAARPPADNGQTTQGTPSRPREEAISLAQHEVPPSNQARRGPGAAMVLSRFGCHRSPFGSFPRVGKNASHIRRCAKEHHSPQRERTPLPASRAKALQLAQIPFLRRISPFRSRSRASSLFNFRKKPPAFACTAS